MRRELKNPDQREEMAYEFFKRYWDEQWSIRDIAAYYGVSFGTARNLLLEGGANLRRRGGPNRRKRETTSE